MRALITRPRAEAAALAALLGERGIEAVIEPLIEIATGAAVLPEPHRGSGDPVHQRQRGAGVGAGERRAWPAAFRCRRCDGARGAGGGVPPGRERRRRCRRSRLSGRPPTQAARRKAAACRRQRRRRRPRGSARRGGFRGRAGRAVRRQSGGGVDPGDRASDRGRRVRFRLVLFAAHRRDLCPPRRGSRGPGGAALNDRGVDQRGGRRDARPICRSATASSPRSRPRRRL